MAVVQGRLERAVARVLVVQRAERTLPATASNKRQPVVVVESKSMPAPLATLCMAVDRHWRDSILVVVVVAELAGAECREAGYEGASDLGAFCPTLDFRPFRLDQGPHGHSYK